MSVTKYTDFFNESVDSPKVKKKVIDNLSELRESILDNIEYDFKSNKVKYKSFDSVDIEKVITKFKEDYGDKVVLRLNIESFFRKINQILYLKKRNTKSKIKDEFKKYIESFDKRLSDSGEYTEEDFFDKIDGEYSIIPRKRYEGEKYNIQIELLKLQEWVIKNNKKIAIVFEGRDAAGKGSTIKRFIEYLNPRHFRVVVLGVPTNDEKNNWFRRYESHLPKPGEIVFFDRSWYNRAVVEPAMGYCTEDQYMNFMDNVTDWEENLIDGGTILIKFWFSITKEKQEFRFKLRQESPLKYWKFSPNDAKVIDKWDVITHYKNQMFSKTSTKKTPWVIVNSNDKKIGRLNAMRYFLSVIDYEGKNDEMTKYYPEVINVIS
jgi:polyphosphate kinase 2